MGFRWSFSTDKLFRRCQRQFYFREIAAHHNAREEWRREAFVLRQAKTLPLWRGSVIHEGIENYVIPAVKAGHKLNWDVLAEQTVRRAMGQFEFSNRRRFREIGITKGAHRDSYCVLWPHANGLEVPDGDLQGIYEQIRKAFCKLAGLQDLWSLLQNNRSCKTEMPIWIKFDEVSIEAHLDLFLQRAPGCPTIVEWKSFETGGDSDARLQTALYGWAVWRSQRYSIKRPEDIELIEVQVLDGTVIKHECSPELFDELEDKIYRSLQRIFSLCQSKRLDEAKLEDFAFTENPNTCQHCAYQKLCIGLASASRPSPAQSAYSATSEFHLTP